MPRRRSPDPLVLGLPLRLPAVHPDLFSGYLQTFPDVSREEMPDDRNGDAPLAQPR
jgi:hypothetical protein